MASASEGLLPQSARSRRIVIVEDDALLTMLLEQVCLHSGHEVVGSAHSPAEGLALIKDKQPDCLLLDYNLNASLTGLDLLEQAHDICPGIFTVLITGWDLEEIDDHLREVRPDGVLHKPLRNEQLVSLLAA